jgi:hypothetical protein
MAIFKTRAAAEDYIKEDPFGGCGGVHSHSRLEGLASAGVNRSRATGDGGIPGGSVTHVFPDVRQSWDTDLLSPDGLGSTLASRETKRALARTTAVACLLIIVVLMALTFGNGEFNSLQVLVSGGAVIAMGCNVYFLYRWLLALASGERKRATWLLGAAWLVIFALVSIVGAVIGFASCAGGCSNDGAQSTDMLFMLVIGAIGVGFVGWLDKVNPRVHYRRTRKF